MNKPEKPVEPLRYAEEYLPRWAESWADGKESISVSLGSLDEEDFDEEWNFVDPLRERFYREGMDFGDQEIEWVKDEVRNGDREGGLQSITAKTFRVFAELYGVDVETVSFSGNPRAFAVEYSMEGYVVHTREEIATAVEASKAPLAAFEASRVQWRADMEQYEEDLAEYELWKVKSRRAKKQADRER